MAVAVSAITKRRAIRAAEHKRDTLLQKQEQVKIDLEKARAELKRQKNQR